MWVGFLALVAFVPPVISLDDLGIDGSMAEGVPFRATQMEQWEEVLDFDGYTVAVVAFVSDTCSFCKQFYPDWQTAATLAKGKLLFVEIDVDSLDMSKLVGDYHVETTPTIKVWRPGTVPAPFVKGQRGYADSLPMLVKQLTYKNSMLIFQEAGVEKLLNNAYKVPEDGQPTTAYVLAALQTPEEGAAFKEVAAYAMLQGEMYVKYVICSEKVFEACGLKAGEARIIRHDLPTDRNETGIMFTKPMTDVRAFHVFSRGSALVPYLELKSTAPIAFYNAATIPMVFVVYNFGATVSGSTGNVVIDEKKKSSAMGHHDLADDEDLLELGWDFLGQAAIVQTTAVFLRKEVKHFAHKFTEEDEDEQRPCVYICKYITSANCYKMDAAFDMSADSIVNSMQIDGEDDDVAHEDGEDGEETKDLGMRFLMGKETIATFITKFNNGQLKFEPRSEAHDLYDSENEAAQQLVDDGSSAGKDGPDAHQKLVGLTYSDWVEDPDLWNLPRVTFLTHEECENCKALQGMFVSLARVASQQSPPVIRFATLDCSKNDPPENVEVHNYPKFVYYPENSIKPLNMRPSELYPHVKGLLQKTHGIELGYVGHAEQEGEVKQSNTRRKKRLEEKKKKADAKKAKKAAKAAEKGAAKAAAAVAAVEESGGAEAEPEVVAEVYSELGSDNSGRRRAEL